MMGFTMAPWVGGSLDWDRIPIRGVVARLLGRAELPRISLPGLAG